jgi:hypothetical protein
MDQVACRIRVSGMIAKVEHARCGQFRAGDRLATWKWEAKILHRCMEYDAINVFQGAYTDLLHLIETYISCHGY